MHYGHERCMISILDVLKCEEHKQWRNQSKQPLLESFALIYTVLHIFNSVHLHIQALKTFRWCFLRQAKCTGKRHLSPENFRLGMITLSYFSLPWILLIRKSPVFLSQNVWIRGVTNQWVLLKWNFDWPDYHLKQNAKTLVLKNVSPNENLRKYSEKVMQ